MHSLGAERPACAQPGSSGQTHSARAGFTVSCSEKRVCQEGGQ